MNERCLSSEEEACSFALQLCSASALQAALRCAMELDLLELMKKEGPATFISPIELAAQISAANPEAHLMIDRILRLLAANNIVNCRLSDGGVERLYSLAPVCDFFTRNEDVVSLAPLFFLAHDNVFSKTWNHMKDAVVEGGITAFERAYGMSTLKYLASDPRLNAVFNEAMSNHSTIIMRKILEIYKGFEGVKCLVDVAGGTGASLKMIVSEFESMKAINFDLPHVIQNAPPHMGVEHVSGDMFVSVPRGDAIFMKWICHDWGDGECLRVLKNCHEALPKEGKVIMIERIVSENIPNKEASIDLAFDVIMLAYFGSGKERTEKEFGALAKASGFHKFQKVACAFGYWIMEFHK